MYSVHFASEMYIRFGAKPDFLFLFCFSSFREIICSSGKNGSATYCSTHSMHSERECVVCRLFGGSFFVVVVVSERNTFNWMLTLSHIIIITVVSMLMNICPFFIPWVACSANEPFFFVTAQSTIQFSLRWLTA